MNIDFKIVSIIELQDGTKEVYLDITPSHQVYLGYLLEGLEGFCYHTISDAPAAKDEIKTQQPSPKLLKVTIVPDFYQEVMGFLEYLKQKGISNGAE